MSPKTFTMVLGLDIVEANHRFEIILHTNNSNFAANKLTIIAVVSFPERKT